MAHCCSAQSFDTDRPRKRRCPENGIECSEVSTRTVGHHIKNPWHWDDRGRRYFFCDDPDCDIVYFGDDDSIILKSQVRTRVEDMLCFCYGVTRADALSDPGIRDYVVEQTKQGLCSCDTSNPSGQCCLKNFPRSSQPK